INRMSDSAGGTSFLRNYLSNANQGLADSVVISRWAKYGNDAILHSYWTLAHEVTHILEDRPNAEDSADVGDNFHFPYSGKLLYVPISSDRANLMVKGNFAIADGKDVERGGAQDTPTSYTLGDYIYTTYFNIPFYTA